LPWRLSKEFLVNPLIQHDTEILNIWERHNLDDEDIADKIERLRLKIAKQ
jgi:hypothetical protein